jgi:hypothetical protein
LGELLGQMTKPGEEIFIHQIDELRFVLRIDIETEDHSTYERSPSVIGDTLSVVQWLRTGTGELTKV